MGRGNITRRGKNSWRLKFDVGADASGKRISRYVTVKGKRHDAQRELTRLLGAADAGTLPEPSKATVAKHLHAWLDGNTHGLAPKTLERYRELAICRSSLASAPRSCSASNRTRCKTGTTPY